MTYPEGREPIKWSELKGYPSDALDEAKALRRDYSLLQIDRNNLRSLLDATEAKVDEIHDKLEAAEDQAKALRAEVERLRYVLAGVRGAIKTGRNEPLVIWKEQIDIALGDTQ